MNQFCKKFYGQDASMWGRGYRRVGLMDGIPYKKLLRGWDYGVSRRCTGSNWFS
jgi:hypothetical protein